MNLTGKVKGITQDYTSHKWHITFEIDERPTEEFDFISKCEKLNIDVKKYRNKRSLDANAYMWILLQQIAEVIHSDRWSVYLDMLQKYSREFTFVICKESAVDKLKELCRTCVDLGEVKVNGKEGHQIQVFFGSSTFDSKAMSVLIDGIVSECKDLGIETIPPQELERMVNQWGI